MFQYADYIYAVYRERSFSKAADKLFITQPSLSITVKKAEAELGLPIFNRHTMPVTLTPFGVEYIQALEQLRGLERRLHEFVEKEGTLQSGRLAIGGSNLGMPYFVTERLADFHRRYPQIELQIRNLNTMQAKHLLDSGELDFVITNRPYDDKKYDQRVCYRECLILAVPKLFGVNGMLCGKRLAPDKLGNAVFSVPAARSVRLDAFAQVPFLLLSNQNYLRQYTDILFRERGVDPPVVLEVEQSAESFNFARLGLGATVLSNRLVQGGDCDALCFYKIDSRYTTRDAFLSSRRGVYFTSAMKSFERMLLDPEWNEK